MYCPKVRAKEVKVEKDVITVAKRATWREIVGIPPKARAKECGLKGKEEEKVAKEGSHPMDFGVSVIIVINGATRQGFATNHRRAKARE